MRGIFGIVDFGLAVPDANDVRAVSGTMARWGRGFCRHRAVDGADFGRVETTPTDEPEGEARPGSCARDAWLFTAEGRLDNRDDLCNHLDIPLSERTAQPDGLLMRAAYDRWSETCAERLLGDWAFAAWHPRERRLVLARDQLGNTSLFYARVANRLAFASHAGALLALPWVPRRLNEIRLGCLLVASLEEEEGSGTIYQDVHLLLPAHTLVATREGQRRHRYWDPRPVVGAELESHAVYAEALLECLRAAVACRVRTDRPVGAMLSGGLDSTAVSLLAAGELARSRQPLTAFTSVPSVDRPWVTAAGRVHDEGPLAALVARAASNINHVLVDAADVSPITGLRTMLRILGEPRAATGNDYWLVGLLSAAAQRGIGVLLTGMSGNHALSWRGPADTWFTSLRRHRFGHAARLAARPLVPARVRRLLRSHRPRRYWTAWGFGESPWRVFSPIRASFAQEMGLDPAPAEGPPDADPRERAAALRRFALRAGVSSTQLGAAFGLAMLDPTSDVRVVSLALSVPARVWRGPMDRWLFRQATDGLLPDEVRLNPRRGLQAADLVDRLRRHRAELDAAFAEIEASPLARRCLDLPYCRQIAAAIDGPPDMFVSFMVGTVLMRALGAGLFLAAFERGRAVA